MKKKRGANPPNAQKATNTKIIDNLPKSHTIKNYYNKDKQCKQNNQHSKKHNLKK